MASKLRSDDHVWGSRIPTESNFIFGRFTSNGTGRCRTKAPITWCFWLANVSRWACRMAIFPQRTLLENASPGTVQKHVCWGLCQTTLVVNTFNDLIPIMLLTYSKGFFTSFLRYYLKTNGTILRGAAKLGAFFNSDIVMVWSTSWWVR